MKSWDFLDKAAVGRGELPKDVVDHLAKISEEIKKLRESMRI